LHAGLRVRREMPFDVELADGLPEQILYEGDAALPAIADLLRAGQGATVEREILLDDGLGQVRGAGPQYPPHRPRLPVVEGFVGPQLRERVEEARLADDDLVPLPGGGTGRGDPSGPVELRMICDQRVEGDQ